jgi:hypothetical protein
MIWTKDNLVQVHIEISTFCNAACPLCPRYFQGTHLTRTGLKLSQITLEQFKAWFPEKYIEQINQWLFCGTHGDPMMAKDVFKILEYIFQINPTAEVKVNTNGGIRKPSDWFKLGQLSKKVYNKDNKLLVVFSVDGLEDTNHLYRRNVDWNKLMANIKSYIDGGGIAAWDFLIFKHNEHQIEEAKNLAKTLGFWDFREKKALGLDWGGKLRDVVVFDEKGEFSYTIEPPEDPKNRNFTASNELVRQSKQSVVEFYKKEGEQLIKQHKQDVIDWDGKEWNSIPYDYSKYDSYQIKCKSKVRSMKKGELVIGSEIYVSADGIVGPCCYIGTQYDVAYRTPEVYQLQQKQRQYGLDNFDLNLNSLDEILEKMHLNKLYKSSWDKKGFEKIMYCSMTCGDDSPIDRLWKNREQKGN